MEDDDDSYYYPHQDAFRDSVIEAHRPSYVCVLLVVTRVWWLLVVFCFVLTCAVAFSSYFRLTGFPLEIRELEE